MDKTDVLRIRIDDYDANILLEKLPKLPRRNIRKILKMLYDPSNCYYIDAQETVPAAIDNWVTASKQNWVDASQQYTHGWRLVSQKSRTKKNLEILAENRRLKNQVKRAKAQYDRWMALQALHTEIMKGSCL